MSRSETPAPPAVDLEVDLDASPAKVWRALTEAEIVDRWLASAPSDGDAAPLQADRIDAEPGRRVSYAWRDGERDSIVTFSISRNAAGGTRLRIVHTAEAAMALLVRAPRCAANDDLGGRCRLAA